jgi:hypothetical protein
MEINSTVATNYFVSVPGVSIKIVHFYEFDYYYYYYQTISIDTNGQSGTFV